jgi:ABC-2 type transport system permease protein
MSKLALIIKREFIAKVRNKSFIVMTFLSPLLFVGIGVFVGYLSSMKAELKTIAIHDKSGQYAREFKNDEEYKFVDLSTVDLKILRDSINSEAYEGLLIIPNASSNSQLQKNIQYISNESPSTSFIESLEAVISTKITDNNLNNAGLDIDKIKNAKADVLINIQKSTGEESLKGLNELKVIIGGAFGYLIMMFIVLYGNMVMRSVIEEKTSRIIEVIISSVKPFQLMMGKIIGTSLAGILQFLIWVILGLSALFIISGVYGIQTGVPVNVNSQNISMVTDNSIGIYIKELWNLPIATILISFIIYFIGGYFLYSSFYASIGAAVDNETDSQQFLLPIIMPLILGVYIGFFTVINDPHGTIATVFSIIPLTSPIVMMMRIPFGVPLWQIIVSIVLLFLTFLGVVWFASKIYRVGILMYGKKPTWRELIKWLKY